MGGVEESLEVGSGTQREHPPPLSADVCVHTLVRLPMSSATARKGMGAWAHDGDSCLMIGDSSAWRRTGMGGGGGGGGKV